MLRIPTCRKDITESMKPSLAIGVDLGATKIAAVLASERGQALATRHTPTDPQRGTEPVMDDITHLIRELVMESASLGIPLLGVGIGSPGRCDSANGVVYNAVNLAWAEVPVVREVGARLDGKLPVWLQKDANASALGEYYFGAARGCRDFAMLTVGSGLGGGVMAGGLLVTGDQWNAAEIGHLSLDPDHGRLCACGQRGCAETVASGPGLAAVAHGLRDDHCYDSPLVEGDITPARVLEAAAAGDRMALHALEEVGSWLGIAAATALCWFNPGRLIIGGGLGLAAFDYLLPAMRAEIEQRVLAASYRGLEILPSQLESSALGAASAVWYNLGVHS